MLLLLTVAALGPGFLLLGYFFQGPGFIGASYGQLAVVLAIVLLSALASLRLLYRRTTHDERYAYGPRYRVVAGLLLLLNCGLIVGFGLGWFADFRRTRITSSHPFPADEYGVAIALFGEGRAMVASDEALEATGRLERDVRQQAKRLQADGVAIRAIGPVRDAVEALKRGRELGAEMVVWGWTEPGQLDTVFPAITKVKDMEMSPDLGPERWMAGAQGQETVVLADEYPISVAWLPTIIAGAIGLNTGKNESAVQLFTAVLDMMGEAEGDTGRLTCLISAVHLYRGRAYGALGYRDLASDDFLASGRLALSAMAQVELGNLHYGEDTLEKALRSYRQAMALDPYYLPPYVGVGNVYYIREEYNAAQEQFLQALRIRPDYAPAYYVLGELHRTQGDVLLARDAFNKCIVVAKDDPVLKLAANEAVQTLSQIPVTAVPAAADGTGDEGASSPQSPQATSALGSRTHVVQSGDNLTNIAQLYDVTIEAIVRANDLRSANAIYAGQELIIPQE